MRENIEEKDETFNRHPIGTLHRVAKNAKVQYKNRIAQVRLEN
jgi:hypothetical protein